MPRTKKKKFSVATLCNVGVGILTALATGILAKIGLYTAAIWTFFVMALLTAGGNWLDKKISRKAAIGIGIAALVVCVMVQLALPNAKQSNSQALASTNALVQKAATFGPNSPNIQAGANSSVNFNNYNLEVRPGGAKPLEAAIDLNELENKYPFGYVVFREGEVDKKFEVSQHGRAVWKINWNGVKIKKGEMIEVTVPIDEIRDKESGSLVQNVEMTRNIRGLSPHHPVPFQIPFLLGSLKLVIYFEVLDDNPRRPVYALGIQRIGWFR